MTTNQCFFFLSISMANVKSLHLQLLKTRWKWKANVRKHGHNMDLI